MFYDNFVSLCTQKAVTPSAVMRAIGLNKSSASYWKKGSIPSTETIQKLADYFGVTVDYLLDIKPLPEKEIELNLSPGKKKAIFSSEALEFRAVNTFLKELGFLIGIDNSLPIEGDPKEAEVWIIADKRTKKVHLAKATDIDALKDRILSFSKFEIYELLHRLREDPRYSRQDAPQPPAETSGEQDTPTPEEPAEGPPEAGEDTK